MRKNESGLLTLDYLYAVLDGYTEDASLLNNQSRNEWHTDINEVRKAWLESLFKLKQF